MKETEDIHVNGTLIWYYYVCPRQVWLMGRQILPDEKHPSIELGRVIHEHAYQGEKKEVTVGHCKIDVLGTKNGRLVVGEVKKSSRHPQAARMQLLFYLEELRRRGVEAEGVLLFPEERRRQKVALSEDALRELDKAKREILRLLYQEKPPGPIKSRFCPGCGYAEYCWA
ncbi:MAG: CRISPR-associated protein Cas4 [Bacillota bacterium]|nr:CRISPR-associated protein Cas4 [Bacillota bacterium]